MTTFYEPITRRHWSRDFDGIQTREKRYDEVLTETIDWTGALDGETISTAAWESGGVTIASESNTTTTTSATISGTGEATITVTTSGGRTLQRRLRWLGTDVQAADYD